MIALRTTAEVDSNGRLHLDMPVHVTPGRHQVLVVLDAVQGRQAPRAFRELAGRLQWTGDALAEQRLLRAEWGER